jgi:hypothetical protein
MKRQSNDLPNEEIDKAEQSILGVRNNGKMKSYSLDGPQDLLLGKVGL